jgi:Rad and Gem related GTP binding protein 1
VKKIIFFRDLFRKRSIKKSKRRACSPLGATTCLSGNGPTNPNTPISIAPLNDFINTPPSSVQSRYVVGSVLES